MLLAKILINNKNNIIKNGEGDAKSSWYVPLNLRMYKIFRGRLESTSSPTATIVVHGHQISIRLFRTLQDKSDIYLA